MSNICFQTFQTVPRINAFLIAVASSNPVQLKSQLLQEIASSIPGQFDHPPHHRHQILQPFFISQQPHLIWTSESRHLFVFPCHMPWVEVLTRSWDSVSVTSPVAVPGSWRAASLAQQLSHQGQQWPIPATYKPGKDRTAKTLWVCSTCQKLT